MFGLLRPGYKWLTHHKAIAFAIAAVCISSLVSLSYVSQETPTWFWDTANYHDQFKSLVSHFQQDRAVDAIQQIQSSIRSSDYNISPVLPILPLGMVLNTSRHLYILAIIVCYLLPATFCAWLLAWSCWKSKPTPLAFLCSAVVITFFPAFWGPSLQGYPDILGLIPLALAGVQILRTHFLTTASTKRIITVSILLWASFLVRRHFAYSIISLLIVTAVFATAKLWPKRRSVLAFAKNLARIFLALGIPSVILLFLFQSELVMHILSTSYASAYSDYQQEWPSKLTSLLAGLGIFYAFLLFIGIFYALRARNVAVLFCTLTAALSFYLFGLTQAPGMQHRLAIYLWLLPGVIASIQLMANLPARLPRALLGAGLLSYSGLAFTGSVSAEEWRDNHLPDAVLTVMPQAYPPQRNESYGQLRKLVTSLENNPKYTKGKIAILASSATINDSIIAAMSSSIGSRLLGISQVDQRDGFRLQVFDADIIVATSGDSVHLGAEHQRVVTVPSQGLFDAATPIAQTFVMDKDLSFPLHDGNTVRIFHRTQAAPYRNESMAAWMAKQLGHFYPHLRINDRTIELN